MQRVKDVESWVQDLERPVAGRAKVVTERDMEEDATSFMAFAKAMGIAPPKRVGSPTEGAAVVPSQPAS